MARRKLGVVSGGLSRKRQSKSPPAQSELASRWRMLDVLPVEPRAKEPKEQGDVIPLLDGWIRRLERQAGLDSAANEG